MFAPSQQLLESSNYINKTLAIEWNINIIKLRKKKGSKDRWSILYEKQKGMCDICNQDLGYFVEENYEIQHKYSVHKMELKDSRVGDLENLMLVHRFCHKTTL